MIRHSLLAEKSPRNIRSLSRVSSEARCSNLRNLFPEEVVFFNTSLMYIFYIRHTNVHKYIQIGGAAPNARYP